MTSTAAQPERAESLRVENARISWLDSGLPYSLDFEDTYHSCAGAREESRTLFIEGNNLQSRWREASGGLFIIAELGFGCALNFLQTLACWRQSANKPAKLHYIAFEKYPLRTLDLARVLAQWPDLAPFAEPLLAQYPEHGAGCHRLYLADDVCLDLHYGDALESLQALELAASPGVNAWYLDGFSPALNPALWDEPIASSMRQLSAPGATVTSYSVAGQIRRALSQYGFTVSKREGFARKRHSLFATLDADNTRQAETAPLPAHGRVLIVGAGLAGCTTAAAFLRRGHSVQLLDAGQSLLSGASGISQLALRPRLFQNAQPQAAFFLNAFTTAQRLWQSCRKSWHPSGVLQFAGAMNKKSGASSKKITEIYDERSVRHLSADQASELSGLPQREPAYYFPNGGWLATQRLADELLAPWRDGSLQIHTHTEVTQLSQNARGAWEVNAGEKVFVADCVVLCNSHAAASLFDTCGLPAKLQLQSSLGQTSLVDPTPHSVDLATVICAERTLFPVLGGVQTIAASYSQQEPMAQRKPSAQERPSASDEADACAANLAGANSLFDTPQFIQERGRERATRSAGEDFLPLVGPAPDVEKIESDLALLRRNARAMLGGIDHPLPKHRGLYLNLGHGSNGLASTPLCAEFLASLASGEPLPLSRGERAIVEPARFVLRAMKKQRA